MPQGPAGFLIPDAAKLASCNETMLLDMVVQTSIADGSLDTAGETDQMSIKACTADYDSTVAVASVPNEGEASLCTTANRALEDASIYMYQPLRVVTASMRSPPNT